jgi:hypothetical protein
VNGEPLASGPHTRIAPETSAEHPGALETHNAAFAECTTSFPRCTAGEPVHLVTAEAT